MVVYFFFIGQAEEEAPLCTQVEGGFYLGRIWGGFAPLLLRSYRGGGRAEVERSKHGPGVGRIGADFRPFCMVVAAFPLSLSVEITKKV